MKDLFAFIYENLFGLYNSNFKLIFDNLYSNGGYLLFGAAFILIPLILWGLFYYIWKYPYGRIWHWIAWFLLIIIVVFVSTWALANSLVLSPSDQALIDALADPSSGYEAYAAKLPISYAFYNSILTLLVSIFYCLFMKQFSKIQMHLPF